jgi:hypothetical protein
MSAAPQLLDDEIAARGGAKAVVQRARQTAKATPVPRFKLMGAAEFDQLPPLSWRVHSVLPTAGVAAIFGPSGCGKSFLSTDLIAALTTGEPWFGYRLKPCRVLAVVLEGEAGYRRRVEAWERANERAFPESARFVFDQFRLTVRDDVLALAAAIQKDSGVDVILIDTLNRAAPECDENASQDMGRILEGVRELQAATGALVLLVHHTGKNISNGMRGHSSLHAALDAAIEVSRTGDSREWKVAKSKDGRDGAVHAFRLQVVDLGEDEDGEPVTSCVVRATVEQAPAQRAKPPTGGNQKIVYDALGPLLRSSVNFGRAGAPAPRPCVTLEEAIDGIKDRLAVEPKRRAERVRQAITGLIASQVLESNEGWLWLK